MSKIVTRQRVVGFMGSEALVPVRIDKGVAIKTVADEILEENNDIEVRFLEDGSVQLWKNGEVAGTITEEN